MRNQSGSSPRKEEEEGNNNNKEMGDVPVRKSNLLVKRKTTVSTLIPFLNHQFLYIYTHTLFCLLDSTFFCLAPTTRPTHLHITVYNLRQHPPYRTMLALLLENHFSCPRRIRHPCPSYSDNPTGCVSLLGEKITMTKKKRCWRRKNKLPDDGRMNRTVTRNNSSSKTRPHVQSVLALPR